MKTIINLITVCCSIALLTGCGRKEVKFNTQIIEKQTVKTTVSATGYVQPVDKVDVGTQVSGVIEKIFVDFNTQVKKGQLLAELDKSTLTEKVTQANASLTSAMSDLTFSQQNYDRTKLLYDSDAATKIAYEQAINTLAQSKTSVANAKANLHQARVNLSYADIYSPIDGVVLNRAVDQGQTVAASFSTPTLFTIAKDLKRMQVEANVDEADIGQVRIGQKVNFTVDSYPEDIFDGTVNQIRLKSVVTNNVVTYIVIVEAPNPEEKLFPGMTANITIVTNTTEGLVVMAEALNFQPSDAAMRNAKESTKSDNGTQVKGAWVKTSDGIEYRAITTGISDGIHIIVEQGLSEGDTVVLSEAINDEEVTEKGSNPFVPARPSRK